MMMTWQYFTLCAIAAYVIWLLLRFTRGPAAIPYTLFFILFAAFAACTQITLSLMR